MVVGRNELESVPGVSSKVFTVEAFAGYGAQGAGDGAGF